MENSPEFCVKMLARIFINVDLPEPFFPVIASESLFSSIKLTFRKIFFLSKSFFSSRADILTCDMLFADVIDLVFYEVIINISIKFILFLKIY